MKVSKKKIKKQGMALMGMLEFVRLTALHHPEIAKDVIKERVRVDSNVFARFVQRVIRMAVKAAETRGKSIDEALLDFQQLCFENRPGADDNNEESENTDE